jgi:hypothetical protein
VSAGEETTAAAAEPTVEELTDALRKAKVGDFLVQTCTLLASFAFGKLTEEALDLAEARLAIDAMKALEPFIPGQARPEVQNVLSSLRIAYAEAASRNA